MPSNVWRNSRPTEGSVVAQARLDRDQATFANGRRELRAVVDFVLRNTKLAPGLEQVHADTRALLLENAFGYAVVFGRRGGVAAGLGPLGDLLLATHQLDWRLGERAISYARRAELSKMNRGDAAAARRG